MMEKLLFNGFALYHEKIIFEALSSGLLCELDTNTGNIRYIENLINYKIERACFDCMLEFDDKLYALANNGNIMMIYNDTENCCEWRSVNCGTRSWGNFMKMYGFNGNLFIFHIEENWVSCYDIESDEIERIGLGDRNENICCCRIENQVWIFPRNGNKLQIFNLENKLYTDYKLERFFKNLISCIVVEEKIFLLQDNGFICIFDISNMTFCECSVVVNDNITEDRVGKIAYASNKLVLFPLTGKDIKEVDLERELVTVYTDYPHDFRYEDNAWSKYYAICEDNRFYYLLRKSNYLLKLDKQNGRLIWLKLQIENDIAREKLEIRYSKNPITEVERGINLLIKSIDKKNTQTSREVISIGEKIWRRSL